MRPCNPKLPGDPCVRPRLKNLRDRFEIGFSLRVLSTGTKVVEPVENQCDEGRNRDRDGEENPSPSETSSSRVAHET